jgi:hypothetical protein
MVNISTCYDFNATVKIDPLPTEISNKCGCITGEIDKIMSLCIVKKEQNNSQSTICTDKMIKVTEDNENGVYILIITNITQMVRYSQVVGNQFQIM